MKIGLFGGTFDPPHFGHLQIAQQVLDFTDCDEVWFVVNFKQNPPKPATEVNHRFAMTQLMIAEAKNPRLKVSTLEIDHKLSGKTIELLEHLPQEHEFRFIIGSDQLPSFHLWDSWQKLLSTMPFYVFPRLGYANEPTYSNMTMINDQSLMVTNISATKVRDRVRRQLPVLPFVDNKVAKYIQENKLYID